LPQTPYNGRIKPLTYAKQYKNSLQIKLKVYLSYKYYFYYLNSTKKGGPQKYSPPDYVI